MTQDLIPTLLGFALVAGAAVFALVPLAQGHRSPVGAAEDTLEVTDRYELYRQILELEFDMQMGKLSRDDYQQLSAELLARAGASLREERGSLNELDAEIEREIAAARAAFAAARTASSPSVGTPT